VPHGLPPERRLDIHRHNVFDSLTEALAAVYPTVAALVGEGFFRYAAHSFIAAHPSRSGNLHEFGSELPAFLEQFEPAASLPYLPDSARLDWAWHAAFHTGRVPAADAAAALMRIAAMADDARLALRLRWQPAARLVASRYPVLRIWQAHQSPMADDGGDAMRVDLDAGPEWVLVMQRAEGVVVEGVGQAEHALLEALSRGASLGEAVAAALAVDAQLDVAGAMARHLVAGTLVGFVEGTVA
jgi:hypothetical protein